MDVVLRTSSPPQLIGAVSEADVTTLDKLRAFLQETNQRRGRTFALAGVWEFEGGKLQVWIFDTPERMGAFISRHDVPIIAAQA